MDQARWIVQDFAVRPTLNEDGSVDFFSSKHMVIEPGVRHGVCTYVEFVFPAGKMGMLRPSANHKCEVDPRTYYHGYVSFVLWNNNDQTVEIQRGDVIAQMSMIDIQRTSEIILNSTDEESCDEESWDEGYGCRCGNDCGCLSYNLCWTDSENSDSTDSETETDSLEKQTGTIKWQRFGKRLERLANRTDS